MKSSPAAIILLMLFSSPAIAQSVLRVHCTNDNEGAEIFINDELKGSCPTDLFLSSGEKTLRAVKPVGDDQERVFETNFMLPADSAKRIKVELAEPQLTAEAKRKRKEARLSRERKAAESAREKAEQGDTIAMRELARYYSEGKGVPENPDKAKELRRSARELDEQRSSAEVLEKARNGDIKAMTRIARRYESGMGVDQDRTKAEEWLERARQARAETAQRKAEQGDISAMKKLARYYARGLGIEKNSEKADEWASRAKKAMDDAREERKRARRIAKAEARDRKLQESIDNTDYLGTTRTMLNQSIEDMNSGGPLSTTGVLAFPSVIVYGPVFDAITAPTRITRVALWKSRMSSRAALFDNPDSMIARAHADQHSLEKK